MKLITLRGHGGKKVTTVDDADYDWVSQFTWGSMKGRGDSYYACRSAKVALPTGGFRFTTRQMQRDLMDPDGVLPRSVKVDHRNGDTLDNRRENIRLSTNTESNRNRTGWSSFGFKGIVLHAPGTRLPFKVRIKVAGRLIYGKMQPDVISAAKEYNRLAIEHFGEFARLNIIPDKDDENE